MTLIDPVLRRPDYSGGSLLNLIASLAAARGARPRHAPLRALPHEELVGARNLVFWLIDGLGANYLADRGRGGALLDHRRGTLTSVFPSTTASAITTTFTGLSAHEHGLTGWHCWFPDAGVLAAPLPFRRRGDERPLPELGVRPEHLLPEQRIVDQMDVRCFIVSQNRIVDSDYSRHFSGAAQRCGYDHLAQLVDTVESAVRSGPERKYIYAYYPDFDAVSHRHGVASVQAAARLQAIDAAFADMLRRLAGTDTVLIASADHGAIDTPPQQALELEHFPALAGLLARPLSGEPRVAYCHIRSGAEAEFIARAQAALGEYADVVASRRLIDEAWFGPGEPHPQLAARVGDVALLMKGYATIKDRLPQERRHVLVGNHGGMTEDEMLIPLVMARL